MKKLSDSLEDYIEIIFYICRRKVGAHTSEIARYLNVKMSSVTRALKCLSESGLLNYSKYKRVLLTKTGIEYARYILEKHRVAYDFLHFVLRQEPYAADEAAKKMKKALDEDTLKKMQEFFSHNARDMPYKHEDCKYNDMRCMLCKFTGNLKTRKV